MKTCAFCAEAISDAATVCPYCQSVVDAPPPAATVHNDLGESAGVRMLLPVGRSGWAIAAGYLGLLSLLPCFAPFAIIVGIVAIRDIKKNPGSHGMGRAVFGIVMGVLGLLAIVVAMILAGR